eukprot:1017955-Prymnesium_polylepis.1
MHCNTVLWEYRRRAPIIRFRRKSEQHSGATAPPAAAYRFRPSACLACHAGRGTMASDDNSFFGLKVPDGNDRRELYKSQYRAIYTYKMSAQELDQAFRDAITGDGPDGGWGIKNDERVKYVGKLEVAKGEEQTLKVCGLLAAVAGSVSARAMWGRRRQGDPAAARTERTRAHCCEGSEARVPSVLGRRRVRCPGGHG